MVCIPSSETTNAMETRLIIKALERHGVTGAAGLVKRYGAERCVEVGRAYAMAKEAGIARGKGWLIGVLREGGDVTEYTELWNERQTYKQQRMYLVKQGDLARKVIDDAPAPVRKMPSRAERFKPLYEFLAQPGGTDALKVWKTCGHCQEDPCQCNGDDVLLRARARASTLKPLVEEEALRKRQARATERRAAMFSDAIYDLKQKNQ